MQKKTWDCWKCNTNHGYRECPAYRHKCKKCQEFNHYEKNCTKYKQSSSNKRITQQVAQLDLIDDEINNDGVYFIVTLVDKDERYSWYESIDINGKVLKSKLDSGAQANVISNADIMMLCFDKEKMYTTDTYITAFGGNQLKPIGYTFIPIFGEMLKFFVINEKVTPTLGLKACERLKLIQRITNHKEINTVIHQDNTVQDLIEQYEQSVARGVNI